MNLIKYFAAIAIAVAISSCNFFDQHFKLSGTAEGVADGTVLIDDATNGTLQAARITNGKFEIKERYVPKPGYYDMILAVDGKLRRYYKIYLERADYKVNFKKEDEYPQIISSSQIQTEISAYQAMLAAARNKAKARAKQLDDMMRFETGEEYVKLAHEFADMKDETALMLKVLSAFIDRYPDNKIAANIMAEMEYDLDPKPYYAVYKKFNSYNKQSDQGRLIGESLEHLTKLLPGAPAPELAGLTPDGKKVDLRKTKKILVLVEFWRAGSRMSRENHQKMLANPFDSTGKNLAIISVSCDTKRDWWLASAKDDKLKWTQISDLKGDDSPNAANWAIASIPSYFLLDSTGHIVQSNLGFNSIRFTVKDYLSMHTK